MNRHTSVLCDFWITWEIDKHQVEEIYNFLSKKDGHRKNCEHEIDSYFQ
jgi:hypothetical protein